MTADQLRKSILQQAIQGKLVPQDPKDEPASVLLERIREEKARLVKVKKAKREKNPSMIFRGEDNSYYEEFAATGEVKCIDDEIPFDLPDGWAWARLGEVVTVKGGKRVPNGYKLLETPTSHIYIRVTDMKAGTLCDKDLRYIDDYVYEGIKSYTISSEDLYLTIAGTIGKVGVVPALFDGMNLTENAVKLADIRIDKMLLYSWICSDLIQSQFHQRTNQVAQPKLAIVRIESTLFPLPPLAEQERIVAKIEELMPWVEQYGKAQSELDQLNNSIQGRLRKSVLQYAIEGKLVPQQAEDGSAEELLAEIQAEKQRLYAAGKLKKKDLAHSTIFRAEDGKYYEQVGKTITCIDEEIPFDLPDGWVWTRLGEIAVSMADGPFGSNLKVEHYTHDPEVRIIQLSNIGEYGWRDSNKRYTTYEHLLSIERSVVDPGDIVIAKMMPAGRAIICPDMDNKYVLSSDAVKLKPASGLDVNFLLFAINSEIFRGQVYSDVQGITRVRTSISKLKGYLVPLPPLAEQQRIVTKLEEVFGVMDRLGQ